MKNLLIIVDFQNDFVTGALGFEKAKDIENVIYEKYEKYLKNDDEIIFTFDFHDDDYLNSVEGQNLPIKHCIKDSFGSLIYGRLNELYKNHKCFYKNTFGSIELGNYLTNKNYKNIEIVGLVSNICVLANAVIVKSALPNSNIFISKNATASYDENMQEMAFKILENLHIKVI